jgi:hypothetical protein
VFYGPDPTPSLPVRRRFVSAFRLIFAFVVHNVSMPSLPSGRGFAENGFGKKPLPTQQHRFEFLGYDFMVDTDMKVSGILCRAVCRTVPCCAMLYRGGDVLLWRAA